MSPGKFIEKEWKKRETAFVFLGRISPEKKIEEIIMILKKIKERGYSVTLSIIGQFDNSAYANNIKLRCNAESSWIKCFGAVYGEKKIKLLSNFRYGISACDCEAFGIATGEMVKAGILPFIPFKGAQKEIVCRNELIYKSHDDAISKIIKVLNSENLQVELHRNLLDRANFFSKKHFIESISFIIDREITR